MVVFFEAAKVRSRGRNKDAHQPQRARKRGKKAAAAASQERATTDRGGATTPEGASSPAQIPRGPRAKKARVVPLLGLELLLWPK
ncbi:MAG: hypothetical protein R3B13_29630 [Polyangiaceae bacterium]